MIIATAGHVDHGKTLLIKTLTGIDTDRLPEEKKRNLTIDLGFAYLPLDGAEAIGFIDVPWQGWRKPKMYRDLPRCAVSVCRVYL